MPAVLGDDEAETPIPLELIPPERYVLDLALGRASTPLMEAVIAGGGSAVNGHGPFAASVASMIELLTGSAPPLDLVRAALGPTLGESVEVRTVVGD